VSCSDCFAKARGEGFEPSRPASKAGGLPLADPRPIIESALRELNPPVQLGRLTPSADRPRARKAEGEGVEPSRLSLDCFRDSCHRLLACPSVSVQQAAVTGIEPVSGRLTAACLYQHRLHRNQSGWQDLNLRSQAPRACAMPGFATPWQSRCGGIEPPVSCSRSTRVPKLPHAPI
jgi:hypothetical protein